MRIGYFGFEVSSLDAWAKFSQDMGIPYERHADHLFWRLDDRAKRVIYTNGPSDDIAWIGWEVDGAEAFEARRASLEAQGIATSPGTPEGAQLRGLTDYFSFRDPDGLVYEIAYGLHEGAAFSSEFYPSGFVSGALGIGHAAIRCSDFRACEAFVKKALGAQISDYIFMPLGNGAMAEVSFLRTNPRHHSLAYLEGPIGTDRHLNHFQIECIRVPEMGEAYDRAQAAGIPIAMSIGQHPNDEELSFYVRTPSKFNLEIGSASITVDGPERENLTIYDAFSSWGHHFATN